MSEKLTLARWSELDQAASPGPWSALYHPVTGTVVQAPGLVGVAKCEQGGADGKLIAASRQAPTRLLAALRGLAAEWDKRAEAEAKCNGENCGACAFGKAAYQLRHLIATLDLSGDTQDA